MNRHHPDLENEIITGELLSNIEKQDSTDKVGSFVQLPTFGDTQTKSQPLVWVCSQEFGALSSLTFTSFTSFHLLHIDANILHFSNLQNMTSMFPQQVLLLLLLLLVQSLIPNTNRSVKPSLVDATRSHEAGVALDALPQEVLSCLQLPTTESQAIKF